MVLVFLPLDANASRSTDVYSDFPCYTVVTVAYIPHVTLVVLLQIQMPHAAWPYGHGH